MTVTLSDVNMTMSGVSFFSNDTVTTRPALPVKPTIAAQTNTLAFGVPSSFFVLPLYGPSCRSSAQLLHILRSPANGARHLARGIHARLRRG